MWGSPIFTFQIAALADTNSVLKTELILTKRGGAEAGGFVVAGEFPCYCPQALAETASVKSTDALIKTSKVNVEFGGGTWLHPKLAVRFARWLSPKVKY